MTQKLSHPVRAWSIWLLSAFFMFYKYAIEVSPSVMTDTLMQAFSIDAASLGNLAACYFYSYLLLQIPAGLLLDKFGPRKITTFAIALCGVGNLVFAAAPTLFLAEIGRLLTGTGAAFAVVNCFKLTANWFPPRLFAFMTGLMMTVAMLGAVGGQAPLAAFIHEIEWRQAMKITGIVGIVLAVLFVLIVRDRSPDHPTDLQLVSRDIPLTKSLREILKHSQSWWLSIYSGFAFAPVMVFGGLWGVSFISTAYELSHALSAQMVSLIFIGFAMGAPLFGWFSDWLNSRKTVMRWGIIASFLMISAVIYAPGISVNFLALFLFLFGFFISTFLLCFTMIREIHSPLLAATAIGFMNAFDALLGAFSDPLTGQFLDMTWEGKLVDGVRIFSLTGYKFAFLAIPIYLLLAFLAIYKIKETYSSPSSPASLP